VWFSAVRGNALPPKEKNPMTRRAAVYFRTSTQEQCTENQHAEVLALIQGRGFELVETYEEQASAMKHRPAYEQLRRDARRGRFDVVVVWSLDRLARGFACFDVFRELAQVGVTVVSVREPWTETDGPARELLVSVMSWVSGFERQRLVERTRAGLERAKRQGKRLGRPKASPLKVAAAVERVRAGASIREAAKAVGVNRETVRRAALAA
jgi:DNA invertase Pin-like site-specific DNA recombinase